MAAGKVEEEKAVVEAKDIPTEEEEDELRDPLDTLGLLMEWLGIMPVVAGRRPYYYYFSVLIHYYGYLGSWSATIFYLGGDHPFFDKMESFQCFVSLIHMFAAFYNLHVNQAEYRELLTTAGEVWAAARTFTQHKDLLKKIAGETRFMVIFTMANFAVAVPICILITTVQNMLVEPEARTTLYFVWDPVPDESWYWTSCVFEGFTMFLALLSQGSSLAALLCHCLQAAGYMRILQAMLTSPDLDINACVAFHQKILMFVTKLQRYFAFRMFLLIILSSLQNSTRIYMCLRMIKQGDLKVVGASFILLLCMVGPFIVCYSGHVLTDNSEKVFISAYQNKWYELSVQDQRSVAILSTMASKIIRVHWRGLLDFNMERYSIVCQATYSYITLLKGADVA